jgi:hypothetical protein
VDGTSIWAWDGVHLTSNAKRMAARWLMIETERVVEAEEPSYHAAAEAGISYSG